MRVILDTLLLVFIRVPAIALSPFYQKVASYVGKTIRQIRIEIYIFSQKRKNPEQLRYASLPRYTRDVLKARDFEIGKYTYGLPTVCLGLPFYNGKLRVGKFCSIAAGVTIHPYVGRRTDLVTTYPFGAFPSEWGQAEHSRVESSIAVEKPDVIIGNDVWIGYGATILSGVEIGDGAIIGAMAVVAKDVEPYSIVAGNPARLIRKRFDEETIRKLMEVRWWDWPVEKINNNLDVICSDNVSEIIRLS